MYIVFCSYPPKEMKEAMAKQIVEEFPQLKCNQPDTLGYVSNEVSHRLFRMQKCDIVFQEHFFDAISRTGFLENRLKTLRKKMNVSEKAYKQRREKGSGIAEENEKVTDDSEDLVMVIRYFQE